MDSLLERLLDAAPVNINVVDAEGRILYINEATAACLGRSKAELLGGSDRDLLPPEQFEAIRETDREVLRTGKPARTRIRLDFPTGGKLMIDQKFPLTLPDGSIAVGGIDITLDDD